MKPRDIILALGLGWLAIGVIAIFAGIFGFIQSLFMSFTPDPMPFDFIFLDVFAQYHREITIAQMLAGVIMIFCSVAFLRLHNWSRYALQVFAFFNIAWGIAFGFSWLQAVKTITSIESEMVFFRIFGIIMMLFGLGVIIAMTGMWSFCIWLLNRPTIRSEFTKARKEHK